LNRRVPSGGRTRRTRAEFRLPGGGLFAALSRRTQPAQDSRRSRPRAFGVQRLGPGYLALLLLVIALVAGAFVSHLYIRYDGIRLGYETSKARALRTRMLLERRELRLELASLKSPGEIELEARERLGMVAPENDRIVPIRPRRTVAASGGAL